MDTFSKDTLDLALNKFADINTVAGTDLDQRFVPLRVEFGAHILAFQGHLGRFARVKIGSKLMARDARRPFDLQHPLCGHASLDPFVDRLIANSQQISELLDTAGFINCRLDS